jgi:hypothetical protein
MKKNVASQVIGAQMVSATDGSAFTGSVTCYVTGDGGTQAVGSVGAGGWPDGTQFFSGDLKDAMLLPAGPTAAQAAAIYAWRGA